MRSKGVEGKQGDRTLLYDENESKGNEGECQGKQEIGMMVSAQSSRS
jgi:hypothetical protein